LLKVPTKLTNVKIFRHEELAFTVFSICSTKLNLSASTPKILLFTQQESVINLIFGLK